MTIPRLAGSKICETKTGLGLAHSCAEAEQQARSVHAAMLKHYGLEKGDEGAPALLVLDPANWVAPFTEAPPPDPWQVAHSKMKDAVSPLETRWIKW